MKTKILGLMVISILLLSAPVVFAESPIVGDWSLYEDAEGLFILEHPPLWTVKSPEDVPGTVWFGREKGTATVALIGAPYIGEVGDEGSIDALVAEIMEGQNPHDTVKLISKGVWDYGLEGNFVELYIRDNERKSISYKVYILIPVNENYSIYAIMTGQSVPGKYESADGEQQRVTFGKVLASIQIPDKVLLSPAIRNAVLEPEQPDVVGTPSPSGLVAGQRQSPVVEDVIAIVTTAAEGEDIGPMLAELDIKYVERASLEVSLKATVEATIAEMPLSTDNINRPIPADWQELQNEIGSFSVAFPRDWTVADDNAESMILRGDPSNLIALTIDRSGMASVVESVIGKQDEIEVFYRVTLSKSLSGTNLGECGTWSYDVDGIYVEMLDEGTSKMYRAVSVPIDSENLVLAYFDPEITDERTLGQVIATIQLLDNTGSSVSRGETAEETSVRVSETLRGRGKQVSKMLSLAEGLTIFYMKHDGDGNFAIWLLDSNGNHVDLLANDIGPFDGSKAIGIEKPGKYILDIKGDGNWMVTIEQ